MALAYGTSDRGACHLRATIYKAELSGMADPGVVEGKAELLIDFEDHHRFLQLICSDREEIVLRFLLKGGKNDVRRLCGKDFAD
ncbi:hypothetical protein E3J59_03050 [Candidatus Aerophobetes bacterium]|uniref:Aldehyde ferredoxin oxidoreductase C-terminal domain-containing protein n=1 Tax=Aerophobetes bacterium TaxID=2030807 RepID=A0A523UVY1_UNCAE|nr:MAG: hypothetical protein E3J59_03050 [Candidatus Aerophobetes bacterium]